MRRRILITAFLIGVIAVGPADAATLDLETLPAVPTAATPFPPLIADVDRDGDLDVVVPAWAAPGVVSILRGKGDGSLEPKEDFPAGPNPVAVAAGELRYGIGRTDLLVANFSFGYSTLFAGADGTYQKQGPFGTATVPIAIGVTDVAVFTPESPIPDIAIAGYSGGGAVGFGHNACGNLQDPPFHCAGNFTLRPFVPLAPTASVPSSFALGFVGGTFEIALADGAGPGVRRAFFDYNTSDWAPVGGLLTTTAAPIDVEYGDFSGDGVDDIATADKTTNRVSVFLRSGASFTHFPAAVGCASINDLAVGDIDRDGKNDLAVACPGDAASIGEIQLHLGRGDGTFRPGPVLRGPMGTRFSAVSLGDLDGDRGLDVVGVSSNAARAVVFRSAPAPSSAPARVGFGEHDALTASAPVTVQVKNDGSGDLRVTTAATAGAAASQFEVVANACIGAGGAALPIAPGGQCAIQVRFSPRELGALTARLEVALARGATIVVPLTGTGVRPGKPRLTSISARAAAARTGARVAFSLSRRAVVTVTLERRDGGRWVRVARKAVTRSSGRVTLTLGPKLGAGAYRVRLSAVDALKRRGAATKRFTVRA